jgi:hypothetical protein
VDNYAKLRYGASAEKKSNTVGTSSYDILLLTKPDPAVAEIFCRFPTACVMEKTQAGGKAGESWEVPVAVVAGNEARTSMN